jgi:hypothetical protein
MYSSPKPDLSESAAASSSSSCGIEPHTRSERAPSSRSRWKIPGEPSQPSLSWIAPTPRALASLIPARVASTHSFSLVST